jgi:4-hydroxy-tetrahydrodipicolinate synthase
MIYSAIGTPLTPDESLHVEGLEAHLNDQWDSGITGVLVAGTMGMMQLLRDSCYSELIDQSLAITNGRGRVLVGVGDTSLARTRDRLNIVNDRKVAGVVALSPYFMKFSQDELLDYFIAIADASTNPLYLYDLPALTGTKLDLETALKLAEHENIRGIKCSCELSWTRQLHDLIGHRFEVIFAQADLVDMLMRSGVRDHLDGIFSLAPSWVMAIIDASLKDDWDRAATIQQKLSGLLRVVKKYGILATFTALLNARGIPGNFAPAPTRCLDKASLAAMLREDIVQELLSESSAEPAPNGQPRKKPGGAPAADDRSVAGHAGA